MNRFNGNVYIPGSGLPAEPTSEGPAAVADAIAALERQGVLPPLIWNDGLFIAAQDHCLDAGKNNLTSWLGSDGSNPGTRMARYGTAGASQGQNLAYGSVQTGLDIVLQLIIDDGAKARTSRQVIFNPNYKLTGIATCAHKTRTMMASALYANSYDINVKGKERLETLRTQSQGPINGDSEPIAPGTYIKPIVRANPPHLDRAIYYWQNKLRTDPKQLIKPL